MKTALIWIIIIAGLVMAGVYRERQEKSAVQDQPGVASSDSRPTEADWGIYENRFIGWDTAFEESQAGIRWHMEKGDYDPNRQQIAALLNVSQKLHQYARARVKLALEKRDPERFNYYSSMETLGTAVLETVLDDTQNPEYAIDGARDQINDVEHDITAEVLAAYGNDEASIRRFREDPVTLSSIIEDTNARTGSAREQLSTGDYSSALLNASVAIVERHYAFAHLCEYYLDVYLPQLNEKLNRAFPR